MVSKKELIKVIADKLEQYQAKQIVIDPVMVSTSKSRLLEEDALYTLMEFLLPLADLITPNIPEAELLAGSRIETERDAGGGKDRRPLPYGSFGKRRPSA